MFAVSTAFRVSRTPTPNAIPIEAITIRTVDRKMSRHSGG